MRVQRRARTIHNLRAVAFPLSEIFQGRASLAHGENQLGSRSRAVRLLERHEIDCEFPLPQPVRDLIEQDSVVRLMPAGRILLFAIQTNEPFHLCALRSNASAAARSSGRSTSIDSEIGIPAIS